MKFPSGRDSSKAAQVNGVFFVHRTSDWQSAAWSKWINVASTFASTPLQIMCNLLILNRFYFLKLLIILWSQVQVLVLTGAIFVG